jgi:hypothetical protein
MKKLKYWFNDRLHSIACKAGDAIGANLLRLAESKFAVRYPKLFKFIFYGTFAIACFVTGEKWKTHVDDIDGYYKELVNRNTLLKHYLEGKE